MRRLPSAIAACVALSIGTAMLAAPGQDRSLLAPGSVRAGEATKGMVFIENRAPNEAIPIVAHDALPVAVQNAASNAPLAVRLSGATTGAPPPPMPVYEAAQPWEYQTLAVPLDATAQDLTRLMIAPGNAGWAPAGVQIAGRGGTLLLLKRPRTTS